MDLSGTEFLATYLYYLHKFKVRFLNQLHLGLLKELLSASLNPDFLSHVPCSPLTLLSISCVSLSSINTLYSYIKTVTLFFIVLWEIDFH